MRRPPLLAALLLCACGDDGGTDVCTTTTAGAEPDGVMVDLVAPTAWQPLAAADDPLADHRPPDAACTFGLGWLVEPMGLEVNTATCNYGAFVQPTLHPIARGSRLSLQLYHFDLLAPEPATAHVAVLIGGNMIFEREIAIPGKANVFGDELGLVACFDAPAGAPVVFHLHNHGQNTWTFASLQVESSE